MFSGFNRLWLFMGVLFIAVSLWQIYGKLDLYLNGARADAVVVGLEPSRGSKGGTLYKAVIEFTDRNNQRQRQTDRLASSPPSYAVSEKLSIAYDPEKPQDFLILGGFLMFFDVIFLGAGILVFWMSCSKRVSFSPSFGEAARALQDAKGLNRLQAMAIQAFVQKMHGAGVTVQSIEPLPQNIEPSARPVRSDPVPPHNPQPPQSERL